MRITTNIILLLIFLAACSQTSEKLIGKWQFVDFYNSGVSDTAKLNEGRNFWKQDIIHFGADKHYNSEGIFPEEGLWDYSERNKTITFTDTSGNKEILNVIKLDSKKLILTFSDNKGLIYEKIAQD